MGHRVGENKDPLWGTGWGGHRDPLWGTGWGDTGNPYDQRSLLWGTGWGETRTPYGAQGGGTHRTPTLWGAWDPLWGTVWGNLATPPHGDTSVSPHNCATRAYGTRATL